MKYILILLLVYYFKSIETELFSSLQDTVRSLLRKSQYYDKIPANSANHKPNKYPHIKEDAEDARNARNKIQILNKAKTIEHRLNYGQDLPSYKLANDPHIGKEYYHMDAVLNQIRRLDANTRRKNADVSSSSLEMTDWKEEFNDFWTQKKFEAVNTTYKHGDQVNMLAARPWGVPCGDPNQHDMPWGTCLMSNECDAEYRIYRGDFICGSTLFICCGLQLSNYDMNQGFDISFADTSFETDSDEKRHKHVKDGKKKHADNNRKRKKERKKRKRLIKKKIKKIVKEIRTLLGKNFKNASNIRKKKTSILKKYIKRLKKQYDQDRKNVRELHDLDIAKVDTELGKKLDEIRQLNKNFLLNATFREIVVNGTINKEGARMLVEAYPELTPYLRGRLRRGGGGEPSDGSGDDYLDYDIEYGAFYY